VAGAPGVMKVDAIARCERIISCRLAGYPVAPFDTFRPWLWAWSVFELKKQNGEFAKEIQQWKLQRFWASSR